MKYYITKFMITAKNGDKTPQPEMMQTARELLAAMTAEAGFESFEDTDEGINGYVQTALLDRQLLDKQLADFPMNQLSVGYTIEDVEDTDWNAAWEQEGFDPIIIDGRCIIHDLIHPLPAESYPYNILIDARQAFGTGTHETTRMIVSYLMDTDLTGKRVVDCGCGTGILSIAASKRGAQEVVSYDIDEWSVENTIHNAQLNQVENIEVFQGDVHVLSHVSGVFDMVMANINRNILLADMPHFHEVMAHGGLLIISGFYVEDGMKIAEKAGSLGLRLIKSGSENDWCMLVFMKE